MAMMMAVIGAPPKHTLLRGHGRHERHHELERAARLERTMREIAVIPCRHKKHADVIERQTNNQIRPVEFQKECCNTGQVNNDEWSRKEKRDAVAAFQSNPTECHGVPSSPGNWFPEFFLSAGTHAVGAL